MLGPTFEVTDYILFLSFRQLGEASSGSSIPQWSLKTYSPRLSSPLQDLFAFLSVFLFFSHKFLFS